jgi:hypothetical protein
MIKLQAGEKVVPLPMRRTPKGLLYAITNNGRVISYDTTPKEGAFLKQSLISGYPAVAIRSGEKNMSYYVHRLVAKHFLKQADKKHRYVIHLNYKKDDNNYKNLKWVTLEGQKAHSLSDPNRNHVGNYKLTSAKVLQIKKKIAAGKTQLKEIAKQFGVSDMQIHRIKTGENWSHVKI